MHVQLKGHDKTDQHEYKDAAVTVRRIKMENAQLRKGKAELASTSRHISNSRDQKCLFPEACVLQGPFLVILLWVDKSWKIPSSVATTSSEEIQCYSTWVNP